MEQAGKLAETILIAAIWFAMVPFLFLVLYTVIQLQTETKAELRDLGALPAVAVVARSERLRENGKAQDRQNALLTTLRATRAADDGKYTDAKNALLGSLIEISADDPAAPAAGFFDECHANRDRTIQCHDAIVTSAQRRLPTLPTEQQAPLRALLKQAAERFSAFLSLSAQTQDDAANLARETEKLGALTAQRATLLSPPGAKLLALTESYDEIASKIPTFSTLYLFPDGVTVAMFTGVMGSVGAAVFSLYNRLRQGADVAIPKVETLVRSYLTRPLLGALAGFMVYFVLSAGASFLLQPQANVSGAINTLSPPALATLGLFAGIAAENALQWLAVNAAKLFKV